MELINSTPYAAHIFRTIIDDERLAASVFTRVTYEIKGDRLFVGSDQPWITSPGPWETEYGSMPSDDVFKKGGVDLFVFGRACAYRGIPTTQMDVEIKINSESGTSLNRRLRVFGDRLWIRDNGRMVPSPPSAFTKMPMTLEHAFGGKDQWDGLDVPFVENPNGKGFYIEEENANNKPLPNIEDPDSLIVSWDDRPYPVGITTAPVGHGGRMRIGVEFRENGTLKKLDSKFFNAAFPEMIAAGVKPGDRVSVMGMNDSGLLEFTIPDNQLRILLAFGDQVAECKPEIDEIGVEVEKGRVFIGYRYPFRYTLVPLQQRRCELIAV